MNKMKKSLVGLLIYFLSILTFAAFNLQGTYGSNIYIVLIALLLLLRIIYEKNSNLFCFNIFFSFYGVFVVVCLLSDSWAHNRELSMETSTSLLRLWVAFLLIYGVIKHCTVETLYKVIMWGGTIFLLYTIITTGISEIVILSQMGQRYSSEEFNANALGLLGSVVSVIWFTFYLYKGFSLNFIAGLIGVLIVVLTGSRKAFVTLVLGFFLVYVLKNKIKNVPVFIIKSLFVSFLVFFILYILFSTSFFSMNAERFESFTAYIMGDDNMLSHSDLMRKLLIEAGWNQFVKTPIWGIGIDNGKLLAEAATGHSYYLHNNYLELLADVGIVGFTSFYILYIYFGKKMFKLYNSWNEYSKLAVTLMLMLLVSDWGRVSYYYKDTLFIMIVCYQTMAETVSRSKYKKTIY